jgi:hypothetical protein
MSLTKKILGQEADRKADAKGASTKYNGDLDAMAKDWAQKTANRLKSNIAKNNLKITGELLDSMSWSINEDQRSISIHFAAHGKYLDLKQTSWSKHPPYEAILAWVKAKPISAWAYVPGYEYRGMDGVPNGMSEELAQSRIAWGIIKSRASGEVVNQKGKWFKKRQWQNPMASKKGKDNLNTAMSHLRHLLEDEIAAHSENTIVNIILQ